MEISDVTVKSKGIDNKILELIDLKTEDDMKQVITELKSIEKVIGEKLQSTDKHLQSMEKSIEKRFDVVTWVIGIACTVIIVAITILALKK